MFDHFRTKLKKSRFARNVLMIASASILGQALLIAVAPILTRLFSPAEFGIAATGLAVAQLVASIGGWRFEWLIPNVKGLPEANRLFALAIIALVVVLCGWLIIAPAVSSALGENFGMIHAVVALVALTCTARAGIKIVEAWYVRAGNLSRVGGGKLALSLVEALASIIAGLAGVGATGLMIAYALAPSAALAFLVTGLSAKRIGPDEAPRLRGISSAEMLETFRKHRWSATVATAASAVNSMSMTMMLLALGFVFDAHEIGYFALIRRMTLMPVSLISSALSQSFWTQAAEQARTGRYQELHRSYLWITKLLGLVAILMSATCYAGSFLIVAIFGEDWAPAGPILIAMIPYLVGLIMFSPTNHLVVFNRQGLQILVDGTRIALACACAFLAGEFGWSLLTTIWLMAISSLIGHLLLFLLQLALHRRSIRLSEPRS